MVPMAPSATMTRRARRSRNSWARLLVSVFMGFERRYSPILTQTSGWSAPWGFCEKTLRFIVAAGVADGSPHCPRIFSYNSCQYETAMDVGVDGGSRGGGAGAGT